MTYPALVTDEPAVLTWAIALAPRPRFVVGRHWWRDLVTETWRAAYDAWLADREVAGLGYRTETEEWQADHPAPRLSDFMRHLSQGAIEPGTDAA